MSKTPVQNKSIFMTLKGQCVSCLESSNYLWNSDGYALTDESTSDGFCDKCFNYSSGA